MERIEREEIERKKAAGLSGSTLKIIAIITMLIDHIGATILWMEIIYNGDQLYGLYYLCRSIGRISFPIFCFLLVEGFMHTSDVKKYAVRLGIFALVSEIPFDLALGQQLIYAKHQDVFFGLVIALLVMMGVR